MSKVFKIKLNATSDDAYELSVALDHVAGQVADGYTSGYLANSCIEDGYWEITEHEQCEHCGGLDGEHEDITTMETVYAGEPHTAPIGSQPCPDA